MNNIGCKYMIFYPFTPPNFAFLTLKSHIRQWSLCMASIGTQCDLNKKGYCRQPPNIQSYDNNLFCTISSVTIRSSYLITT